MNNLLQKFGGSYPAITDLKSRAKKRVPHVAWEYLDGGTGDETAVQRNLDGFNNITLLPQLLKGKITPDISTTFLGRTYSAPFGVAPIGMSGFIWPQSEVLLARTAVEYQIPYTLSTAAAETPENVGPHVGDMGWFQLYPPQEKALRKDLLQRAQSSGFHTLVVTADTPVPSRRERMVRAGLKSPPAITPRFVLQALLNPAWTMATLKAGLPYLKTLEKYTGSNQMRDLTVFLRQNISGTLSWNYLQQVRDEWPGKVIIKGLLHPEDVERAIQIGVDGIQVSNHGARQFNGSPAAIEVLPMIVEAVQGRTAVLFDSGVRSGLDILRAILLGADFIMLGRAFMYGAAALGQNGTRLVVELLSEDLKNNMIQMGCANLDELRSRRNDLWQKE